METVIAPAAELDVWLAAYSAGSMSHRELERLSGLWFGDILEQLAHRQLPLPRFDSRQHFNAAQLRLFQQVFG